MSEAMPLAGPEAGPSAEERQWAMLAHLSVLLNLVTGLGGPIAAFLIYLFYRERSRYVAVQSLQALIFQLLAWAVAGVIATALWAVSLPLTAAIIGICLIPVACLVTLIPLGALVYGVVGGIACNRGEDFRYWLIGDWVANTFA
ncbi:MAG: DUF4870 domain-containing protein [Thermoflexus sp.]|jgi:uncharacterized Tic20 family protein|nr:DUF4870 domain-containing protein [Thermoflexus sp.]